MKKLKIGDSVTGKDAFGRRFSGTVIETTRHSALLKNEYGAQHWTPHSLIMTVEIAEGESSRRLARKKAR